jgi:DNA-binding transcriptional regulator YiaG
MPGEHSLQDHGTACPDCLSEFLQSHFVTHDFEYGLGEARTTLSATYPVLHCNKCSYEFADRRAEEARHEAVCRHLGVLTPSEIVAIREERGLTRAEFAELGGFGLASLQRWETGSQIQNASNDRLIFLLQFSANSQRLTRKLQDARRAGIDLPSVHRRGEGDAEPSRGEFYRSLSLEALTTDPSLIRNSEIFSEMLSEGVFTR